MAGLVFLLLPLPLNGLSGHRRVHPQVPTEVSDGIGATVHLQQLEQLIDAAPYAADLTCLEVAKVDEKAAGQEEVKHLGKLPQVLEPDRANLMSSRHE